VVFLRVLHIGNTAAVGSTLAKYSEADLIARSGEDLPWHLTYYGDVISGDIRFVLSALWRARRYDLLHVHYQDRLVRYLRMRYRRKPIVMHYHGTDIRGRWDERRKYWSMADAVLVSTPDLLNGAPEGVVLLPNPVDTSLFFDKHRHRPGTALAVSHGADDLAREYADRLGLDLVIHDRYRSPIPFVAMPDFLADYEYYIDVRRGVWDNRIREFLAKTALEALACGLKVVRWDCRVVEGLPRLHYPDVVVERLLQVYESCS